MFDEVLLISALDLGLGLPLLYVRVGVGFYSSFFYWEAYICFIATSSPDCVAYFSLLPLVAPTLPYYIYPGPNIDLVTGNVVFGISIIQKWERIEAEVAVDEDGGIVEGC